MLPGAWGIVASSAATVIVGVAAVWWLRRCGFHRDASGTLQRPRIASVFVAAATTYTFATLTASELVFKGPAISVLIHEGFGDQRIAWLLVAVVIDSICRLREEFRRP